MGVAPVAMAGYALRMALLALAGVAFLLADRPPALGQTPDPTPVQAPDQRSKR